MDSDLQHDSACDLTHPSTNSNNSSSTSLISPDCNQNHHQESISGHLYKRGRKLQSWKKRFFKTVLPSTNSTESVSEGTVYYYKNQKLLKQPSGSIDLTQLKSVSEYPDASKNASYGIRVLTQNKIWDLAAETPDEQQKWINYFKSILRKEELRIENRTEERLRKLWTQQKEIEITELRTSLEEKHQKEKTQLTLQHEETIRQLKHAFEEQQSQHNTLCKRLEEKNQQLQDKLQQLDDQNADLNRQLTVKCAIIDQDTIQSTLLREQIETLKRKLKDAHDQHEETCNQLKVARKDCKKAVLHYELFKSEIEKDQEEMRRMRRELELQTITMEKERESLEHDKQNTQIEQEANHMLRRELEQLQKNLNTQEATLKQQKEQLILKEKEMSHSRASFQQERLEQEQSLVELEKFVDSISLNSEQKKVQIAQLMAENQQLKQQHGDTHHLLEQKSETVQKLEHQLEVLNQKFNESKSKEEEFFSLKNTLESQLQELREQLSIKGSEPADHNQEQTGRLVTDGNDYSGRDCPSEIHLNGSQKDPLHELDESLKRSSTPEVEELEEVLSDVRNQLSIRDEQMEQVAQERVQLKNQLTDQAQHLQDLKTSIESFPVSNLISMAAVQSLPKQLQGESTPMQVDGGKGMNNASSNIGGQTGEASSDHCEDTTERIEEKQQEGNTIDLNVEVVEPHQPEVQRISPQHSTPASQSESVFDATLQKLQLNGQQILEEYQNQFSREKLPKSASEAEHTFHSLSEMTIEQLSTHLSQEKSSLVEKINDLQESLKNCSEEEEDTHSVEAVCKQEESHEVASPDIQKVEKKDEQSNSKHSLPKKPHKQLFKLFGKFKRKRSADKGSIKKEER